MAGCIERTTGPRLSWDGLGVHQAKTSLRNHDNELAGRGKIWRRVEMRKESVRGVTANGNSPKCIIMHI